MNIKLLLFFILLNVVNVILQTIKSLLTNKGNKWTAAIGNAVAYGLYTVLLVYMSCNLTLWAKVLVVGGCNLIGVFIVKLFEEKMQKEKLWRVELNIPSEKAKVLHTELENRDIPHNYIYVHKWAVFSCYCSTKEESRNVRELAKAYNAKYFVAEGKNL